MMKYCPQYFIDKDVAGAYVIGRKALGFQEEIPENYKKLLKSQIYIQYALWRLGKMEDELKNKLNQEKNKYKANGIKRDLRRLKREKKFLEKFLIEISNRKSSQSEPETQKQVYRRKEPVRGPESGQKLWRVLRVAFTIPLLGKSFARDFSPLRPVLVQGRWEGIAGRLGPDGFAGPPRKGYIFIATKLYIFCIISAISAKSNPSSFENNSSLNQEKSSSDILFASVYIFSGCASYWMNSG
jgi:hypothetical protein